MSKVSFLCGPILVLAGCGSVPDLPVPRAVHPASGEAAEAPIPERSGLLSKPPSPTSSDAEPAKPPTHPSMGGGQGQ